MIQADEYQPGEMPRDIIPLAETAMILVDTENMPEDGKENHTCDAYSRNDSNFYTLQYKENGYCLSNYHVLKWPDPDRAADLTWKVENGTLTISGHGNMDNYDDKPAPWNGMNYSRLVVEEGITSLGYGAFRGNDDLREINLPESLITIGPYAFSDCDGLTDITIPSSVTEIEYYAFSSCSHLRKVTLPDSVTFINTCAFHQCVGLEHINLPASVKDFGIKVFDNCGGLKSITVAEGSQAEYYCKEDKLPYDYGEGTPVMTPGANTSITWKIEDDTLFITGTGDMDDYRTRFIADNRYGTNAPWNEEAFSKVVIGEGITSIGEKAFSNNDTLVSATLPDSLNKIGNNAFYDCENLEEVNLPKRLETIGENACYYCTSLKNLTLPVSLKMIGFSAFQCCFALKEVIVPNNAVMVISYDAFSRCTGLEKVVLPATVKEIRNRAFDGCTNLQEIVVEKGSYAEQYCIDNNLPYSYSN